jgi:hypothetical protein
MAQGTAGKRLGRVREPLAGSQEGLAGGQGVASTRRPLWGSTWIFYAWAPLLFLPIGEGDHLR